MDLLKLQLKKKIRTTDLQHERAHIGLVIPALLTVIYENQLSLSRLIQSLSAQEG